MSEIKKELTLIPKSEKYIQYNNGYKVIKYSKSSNSDYKNGKVETYEIGINYEKLYYLKYPSYEITEKVTYYINVII